MPWAQTGATHYYTQLDLPDKGLAIKGLAVCSMAKNYDLSDGVLHQGKVP